LFRAVEDLTHYFSANSKEVEYMPDRDSLQRFLFEHLPIRGELVHLDASWQEVLRRHDYPEPVRDLLGQMLTAVALLSSTLKFEGSLIMQLQGKGPVSLAVAECTSDNSLRGLAHWEGAIDEHSFPDLVGEGILVITIDPDFGERYQGVIDVSRDSLAEAIEDYMSRSQQIETRLWLTADAQSTAGMLLQLMPDEADEFELQSAYEEDADAWNRITHLAATVQTDELINVMFQELLYRLFNEEDVRVFEKQLVSFRCSCTHERVRDMLRMLGREEVQSILQEQGKVGVNCQFCNHYYEFDAVDAEMLFAADVASHATPTRH
jgi:molecular chaperone Hsp33